MLRLIQGDVGSGKTAVAAYALALAARTGGQAALLAPTDLLARQLAGTVGDLLSEAGVPVTLLTGSLSAAGRRSALEAIATGLAPVVVGTHALLQPVGGATRAWSSSSSTSSTASAWRSGRRSPPRAARPTSCS